MVARQIRGRRWLQLVIVIAILVAYYALEYYATRPPIGETDGSALARAIATQSSEVQVEGGGEVIRVLDDDNLGSRHQRFLVRLESGDVILIAHNIDLAPRVNGLRKGDTVSFFGVFEWNDKGGVVHWTHHDPAGRHPGGWIRHRGETYQ